MTANILLEKVEGKVIFIIDQLELEHKRVDALTKEAAALKEVIHSYEKKLGDLLAMLEEVNEYDETINSQPVDCPAEIGATSEELI